MKYFIPFSAWLLPVLTFAQTQGSPDDTQVTQIVDGIETVVNALLPIVVTLAVLFFFWGLALFILGAGDESQRERGKSIMLWGIIALFIIVAIWGILQFIANLVGVETNETLPVPGVEGISG